VSAHRLLVFLKILVAFPPNYLGLLIGLVMPFMLGFQRELSAFDWLTMAFFNVPNLIFLRSAILNETPVSSPTFMAALGITFLGLGGFGVGWLLALIGLSVTPFIEGVGRPATASTNRLAAIGRLTHVAGGAE
jgi:hypothetical protein